MMNEINEICLLEIKKNNLKKFQFIKRKKYNERISLLYSYLRAKSPFSLSNDFITFLSGLSYNRIYKNIGDDIIFKKDSGFIRFKIENIIIDYSVKRQQFTITDGNYGSYIYSESTMLTPSCVNMWNSLENDVKDFYIKTIHNIALDIAQEG
jgi:hypothetical protein